MVQRGRVGRQVAVSSPARTSASSRGIAARTAGSSRSRSISRSRTVAHIHCDLLVGPLAPRARRSRRGSSRWRVTAAHTSSSPAPVCALHASTGGRQRRPGRRDHPQRPGQLAGGGAGVALVRAVGLVHRDDVGELEDALLDALQLVAGAGDGQQEERVDHARRRRPRTGRRRRSRPARRRSPRPPSARSSPGWRGRPRRACRRSARAGRTRSRRRPGAPSGSCRRGSTRRCGSTTGRPPAPPPGARPR